MIAMISVVAKHVHTWNRCLFIRLCGSFYRFSRPACGSESLLKLLSA
jgi:hypothetical protein